MSNVLFVAEGCKHSEKLIEVYGPILKDVCDRIYYFNPREGQTKRKKATMNAIEYHGIQQFPTLIWEGRRVLKTQRLISRALNEAFQQPPEQQITNLKTQENDNNMFHQQRMVGGGQTAAGTGAAIDPHSLRTAKVNTADIGAWPEYDVGVAPTDPHQRQQELRQQLQQEYAPGGNQQQQQQYLRQQPQQYTNNNDNQQQQGGMVQGLQMGHDPHNNNGGGESHGVYHGIGMGSMVGAPETDIASNVDLRQANGSQHGQEQELVGAWPTNRRVRGLTGSGVMGGNDMQSGPADPYKAQHQQQRDEMFRQRGNVYQQSGSMAVQYGQPVADPYKAY